LPILEDMFVNIRSYVIGEIHRGGNRCAIIADSLIKAKVYLHCYFILKI